MRIVIISDWFSEKMGYAENCLPKAIASLGPEVHLVTSNVQTYFDLPEYAETYAPFLGPAIVGCGTRQFNGYTLHRLPYKKKVGRLGIQGLVPCLRELRPDIVQTFDAFSLTTFEAALARPFLGYKLFLESHVHASVFPPLVHPKGRIQRMKWRLYARTIGLLTSLASEKCYPISSDAAEVATQFLGMQRSKIQICPLGVDTDLFRPVLDESPDRERIQLRKELGLVEDDIVCVYTGRFSEAKNPLCLARAIGELIREGLPFRGLFVGNGTEEQVRVLRAMPGCVVHPFVPVQDLPPFYRAADIGVWPEQESTSQLDAAACGLPIIISDRVQVRERVEGNGLFYKQDDHYDLAQQIKKLVPTQVRQQMGRLGISKMREQYSWIRIAQERLADYKTALGYRCDK